MACGEAGDDVMACGEARHGELLTSLVDLLQDQDFTDLKLRLRDGEEVCSRFLVAALSPVFRCMLADPLWERNQGEVVLEHVSKASWNVVLSFYFRGENLVTADNVEEIIMIAEMYDMKSLKHHCSVVYSDLITDDNWLHILQMSRTHNCDEITQNVLRFIGRHFDTVVSSDREQFSRMPRENLLRLLEDEYLVTTEDNVCRALLSWLEQNQVDEGAAVRLLDQVRLEDVSTECLNACVLQHEGAWVESRAKEELQSRGSQLPEPTRPCSRAPKFADHVLVLGHDGERAHVLGGAGSARSAWRALPAAEAGDHFAAVLFRESVYVTGGFRTYRSTLVLDVPGMRWSRGPDLLRGRYSHAMARVGDALFVLGGQSESPGMGSFTPVERFRSEPRVWEEAGHLVEGASSPGVASLGDVILVVGDRCLRQSVQAFDVRTQTSTVIRTEPRLQVEIATGAKLGREPVFLTSDGRLVRVEDSHDGGFSMTHVVFQDFGRRQHFGLLVDDCVEVYGGQRGPQLLSSVDGYRVNGEREEGYDCQPLPLPLKVYGVFRTKLLQ